MCAIPGYGGNAPGEDSDVSRRAARMRMPGRWPDRLRPDSPPRPYGTSRTESGGGPSAVRALERRQWSRAIRPARKAVDVPGTVPDDPRARLAPPTQKRQHPDYLPRARDPSRDRRGPRSRRHHQSLPHPGDDPPRRPDRHGRHRPGQDRYRQDAGIRSSAPRARHRPRRRGGRARQARGAHRRPAGARRGPDPRAVHAGHQRPADRGQGAQRARSRHLRRPCLRAAGRGPQAGRRRRRRHPRPAAGPRGAEEARPQAHQVARPRRGRRDARPGLPAGRREDHQHASGEAPDHAVLGDHARRGHRSRPPLHVAAHAHQRHLARRRGQDGREHQAARVPRAQHGQARDGRAHTAGRRPGTGHGLLPYEADGGRPGRPAPAARFRLRRGPRRPRSGRARAGAAGLPQRQGGRARLHRRRRPRHRRRGCDPRHQLPVAGRREDVPAPHRPYRPRGCQGHRDHPGRLGRHPPLAAHQQGAGPRPERPAGDVLHLPAPLRGPQHPRGHEGCPAARRAHACRARRGGGGGPRRDRWPRCSRSRRPRPGWSRRPGRSRRPGPPGRAPVRRPRAFGACAAAPPPYAQRYAAGRHGSLGGGRGDRAERERRGDRLGVAGRAGLGCHARGRDRDGPDPRAVAAVRVVGRRPRPPPSRWCRRQLPRPRGRPSRRPRVRRMSWTPPRLR